MVCGLGGWREYREIVRTGRVAGDGVGDGRACGGWSGRVAGDGGGVCKTAIPLPPEYTDTVIPSHARSYEQE